MVSQLFWNGRIPFGSQVNAASTGCITKFHWSNPKQIEFNQLIAKSMVFLLFFLKQKLFHPNIKHTSFRLFETLDRQNPLAEFSCILLCLLWELQGESELSFRLIPSLSQAHTKPRNKTVREEVI